MKLGSFCFGIEFRGVGFFLGYLVSGRFGGYFRVFIILFVVRGVFRWGFRVVYEELVLDFFGLGEG